MKKVQIGVQNLEVESNGNAMGQRFGEFISIKYMWPKGPCCHIIRREGEGASPKSEDRGAPRTPEGDGMR